MRRHVISLNVGSSFGSFEIDVDVLILLLYKGSKLVSSFDIMSSAGRIFSSNVEYKFNHR